jgi:hypothetical protein
MSDETDISRVQCMLRGAHDWQVHGGRPCPHGVAICSQIVYRCARCGDWDYGEVGGPTDAECEKCDKKI